MYTLNIFKVDIKCYNRTGGSSNQSALPHMFSGAETRPGASFFFLLSQILSLRRFQSHLNETFGTQTAHFSFVCCCEATLDFRNVSTLCVALLHLLFNLLCAKTGRKKKKRHPVRTLTFLDKSLKCNSYSAVDQEASSQTFRYFELIRHF